MQEECTAGQRPERPKGDWVVRQARLAKETVERWSPGFRTSMKAASERVRCTPNR